MNLSQRAWNNVIILTMVFMVYLFSISNKFIAANDTGNNTRPLLPEHSVIMTAVFSELTLQRMGRGWRVQGSENWQLDQLQAIIHTWQHAVVSDYPYTTQPQPYVVTLLLAGEEQQRVFLLSPHDDGVLITSAGKSAVLAHASLGDLTPSSK